MIWSEPLTGEEMSERMSNLLALNHSWGELEMSNGMSLIELSARQAVWLSYY